MIRAPIVLTAIFFAILAAGPARAEPIPEPVARMIDEAVASGNGAALDTVADIARKTYPKSAAEIDAVVAQFHTHVEEERVAKLENQTFFEGWKGEGELGASRNTGNTDDTNVVIGVHLAKDGLRWAHKFNATVDYQRIDGVSGTEKFLVGYEPNYKFNDDLYVFGLLQWERDRFGGFDSRTTESFGIGYNILHADSLKWSVTAGPAFREIDPIIGRWHYDANARLGSTLTWTLSKSTVFTENLSFYVGGSDNTAESATAITTKIVNALAARFSFDIKKETNPDPGFRNTDTISRVTLVYGF